jgi:uncharacterized membrane protein
MIESIITIFESVAFAIDLFGLTLLVLGFVRGAFGWVRTEFGREPWELRVGAIRKLRCMVGLHILFALELMIVSDIIGTFVAVGGAGPDHPNFFHSEVFYALVELGSIVLIRTVIDYFLGKEIGELRVVTP